MEGIITPEKISLVLELLLSKQYGGPDTVFKDWKAHGYVDMREALAVSSDEYFIKLVVVGIWISQGSALRVLMSMHVSLGLVQQQGIDLPNEKSGTIPTPEWKKEVFWRGLATW